MMKFRKIVCLSLSILMVLSQSFTVAAGTPSQGGGPEHTGTVSNGVANRTPAGDHGGVRVTVTNMVQAGAANAQPVDGGASYTEAVEQYDKLAWILKTKVWQPGMFGLLIYSLK